MMNVCEDCLLPRNLNVELTWVAGSNKRVTSQTQQKRGKVTKSTNDSSKVVTWYMLALGKYNYIVSHKKYTSEHCTANIYTLILPILSEKSLNDRVIGLQCEVSSGQATVC